MTPEQALQRVKSRLIVLPTGRIFGTERSDAISLGTALDIVDEVIAQVRKPATAPKPESPEYVEPRLAAYQQRMEDDLHEALGGAVAPNSSEAPDA